jgi:adenosylhomocysteine nucleosidase
MKIKTIGLIAAMPEEIAPLISRVGPVTQEKLNGFRLYRFTCGDKNVVLIESGIGAQRAEQAARALLGATVPDVILNFGFGGAVLPGPNVGDIVLADRLLLYRERLFTDQTGLSPELTEELATLLELHCRGMSYRMHRGTFVTSGEIIGKQTLAGLLPLTAGTPVLEMETAAVAEVTRAQKVPLAAIRAISDGAEEDLDFSIAELTDREMRISIRKVLWTIARKPRIIPQLIRLGKNSRRAGENLAAAVLAVLERL